MQKILWAIQKSSPDTPDIRDFSVHQAAPVFNSLCHNIKLEKPRHIGDQLKDRFGCLQLHSERAIFFQTTDGIAMQIGQI